MTDNATTSTSTTVVIHLKRKNYEDESSNTGSATAQLHQHVKNRYCDISLASSEQSSDLSDVEEKDDLIRRRATTSSSKETIEEDDDVEEEEEFDDVVMEEDAPGADEHFISMQGVVGGSHSGGLGPILKKTNGKGKDSPMC
ncbi:hypothetical protein CAEBREN_32491 [Caenorhabditis brenneri]|uniref:Uncharacterized protein n=1 Tax=Caenorhabditis brenneri TaxID=135651 RepID=G0PLV9_CAEBE|nr:hypothetical protein CAEBREN_32491 [Caenorhabditis brenneri]